MRLACYCNYGMVIVSSRLPYWLQLLTARSSRLKPPGPASRREKREEKEVQRTCFGNVGIRWFPKSQIIPGEVALTEEVAVVSWKAVRFSDKVSKLATLMTSLTSCSTYCRTTCLISSHSTDQIKKLNRPHVTHTHTHGLSVDRDVHQSIYITFLISFYDTSVCVQGVKFAWGNDTSLLQVSSHQQQLSRGAGDAEALQEMFRWRRSRQRRGWKKQQQKAVGSNGELSGRWY